MLSVRGLRHCLGTRVVLEGIDLDLQAGEVAVIMGPNGAGKTTLLRLLAGIFPVQNGSLHFLGESVGTPTQRQRLRAQIGLVTESPGLYEQLSVRENLRFFGRLQGLTQAECDRRIATLGASFELGDRLTDRAGSLSKGLRQRVALLRAVLHQPRLLLLDEPSSGLDPDAADQLHEWVACIRATGVGIVLASHDFAEVQRLGGVVHVLNQRMSALAPLATARLHVRLSDAAKWCQHLRDQGCLVEIRAHESFGELMVSNIGEAELAQFLSSLILAGAQVHGVQWRQADPLERYRAALAETQAQS